MWRRKHHVWKGLAAGLAGGLVASWVMNQFQELWSKAAPSSQPEPQPQGGNEDAAATVKLAEKLAHAVLHRGLSDKEKKVAEPAVHYGYGAVVGGVYGALAELEPRTTVAAGVPFGAALWLAGDEVAVPALGLAKGPREYPLSSHVQALAAHCVYGVTADVVRRVVLKAIA